MTWQEFIQTESKQDYFLKLQAFLEDERQKFVIQPKENEVFQAFELTKRYNYFRIIFDHFLNELCLGDRWGTLNQDKPIYAFPYV
jgi:hypothetical protein